MAAQAQRERFIAALSKLGGSAGNGKLREALGWDEVAYSDVKQALIAVGIILPGRGRGGSVRLLRVSGSSSGANESGQQTQPRAAKSSSSRRRKGSGNGSGIEVTDYRHDDTRKNIPPAKIAAEGRIPAVPKITYSYSPRLDPTLHFDDLGGADALPELLATARQRALTEEEARVVAEALRVHEPWLEWAGKRETKAVEVDPVALHIHERVSSQAILKVAARQDITRDLFADPQQEYHQAVQFYQHDIDWTNRLILGDSLQVMASLAQREDLAGKVQMIYFDPPYGIRFGSNFQVDIGDRDSNDQEKYLTREPEMIRAYRDTWSLGIHSYFSYLRDRLHAARDLLKDTGSIFVQIGDENLPAISLILDEVFGRENRIQIITIKKKSSTQKGQSVVDYLLWYAKDRALVKMPDVYTDPGLPEDSDKYRRVELSSGERRAVGLLSDHEKQNFSAYFVRDDYPVVSQHYSPNRTKKIIVEGREVFCGSDKQWRYDIETGMRRLEKAGRLRAGQSSAFGVMYWGDSRLAAYPNVWTDVHGESNPIYVVQTNRKIVERCMLMSTEPGDLVLDPTCGSGTTAYVAEQWGRRWITIDTSRVAVAIARQRVMTADFEYFELKESEKGVDGGFRYKTVGHVTLRSIAMNEHLDPILAKHEAILDERLEACNSALETVTDEIRQQLHAKLVSKQRAEGKRAVTEADTRRWILPTKGAAFEYWTMPFDCDPDWPQALSDAVTAYRSAWRSKMDEVDECIAANAEQTELVDQPIVRRGVLRVSGPFTVEAVQPPEVSLDNVLETPIGGAPEEIEDIFVGTSAGTATADGDSEAKNAEAYLDQMMRLLKIDGVRFPDNKQMAFSRLDPVGGRSNAVHAEGRWAPAADEDRDKDGRATVAVAFGPQYGPVTAQQVEQLIRAAARRGYDDLVISGFNFDGAAQAVIDESDHPDVRVHMAHIRPDVNPGMAGLLKEQPGAQLFTVFGQPRTLLDGPDRNGDYVVRMEGVDIYNPVDNTVTPSRADKVAAWFLDSDYDGRTFCISQAFFPDKSAWSKLSKALGGVVDPDAFEKLTGTDSMPFPACQHRCVAVKVIDPRGNEVMRVHRLED